MPFRIRPSLWRFATIAPAALLASACSVVPDSSQASHDRVRSPQTAQLPATQSAAARQCHAQLGASRASFSVLPDRNDGMGCSTSNSVQLSALQGDSAQFSVANLGPVACPLASDFAAWARYGVDRAARQILGSGVARIETFGSYSCRNVAGTARRSAHSTANAIDVSAFVLENGRRVSVKSGWSGGTAAEREFLRTVHSSACKRFGTVLGPAYNAAHEDHLHLESSGGGFCR